MSDAQEQEDVLEFDDKCQGYGGNCPNHEAVWSPLFQKRLCGLCLRQAIYREFGTC